MPRKKNNRKAVQAQKREALAQENARKNKKWAGTRRDADEGPQMPRKVAVIAHHHSSMALAALLLGARGVNTLAKHKDASHE